jgi:hypothetical protein
VIRHLNKPVYVYHPRSLARRLRGGPETVVSLPWGLTIEAAGDNFVCQEMRRTAVCDLVLTEALFRR